MACANPTARRGSRVHGGSVFAEIRRIARKRATPACAKRPAQTGGSDRPRQAVRQRRSAVDNRIPMIFPAKSTFANVTEGADPLARASALC